MFKSLVSDASLKIYNRLMSDLSEHKPRPIMHSSLQNYIWELGKTYAFYSKSEFYGSKGGRIDVVWFHPDDSKKPYVIFEIDSSLRKKSIQKLCQEDSEIKFWVIYPRKEPNPYAILECEKQHDLIIIYPDKYIDNNVDLIV